MSGESDTTTGAPGAWIAGAGAMHPSAVTHAAASLCPQLPRSMAVTVTEFLPSGASGQAAAAL